MSSISSLRFGHAGPFDRTKVRHPLLGRREFTVVTGPIYDSVSGLEVTRGDMLAHPYHYSGDINRVPSEVLAWVFAKEADLSISWGGMSAASVVVKGYQYGDIGDGSGLVRSPEEDYDRVLVWLPGTAHDTEEPANNADYTFPQPSIWTIAEPYSTDYTNSSKLRVQIETAVSPFSPSGYDLLASFVTEGTETTEEVDTGIVLDPEEGSSYKLRYVVYEGASGGWVGAAFGGVPTFYPEIGVWAAPMGINGVITETVRATTIIEDATYELIYNDSGHPEWRETIDEIVEGLLADDETTITNAEPVGIGRFTNILPVVGATVYDGEPIHSATDIKQFPRFLDFER